MISKQDYNEARKLVRKAEDLAIKWAIEISGYHEYRVHYGTSLGTECVTVTCTSKYGEFDLPVKDIIFTLDDLLQELNK